MDKLKRLKEINNKCANVSCGQKLPSNYVRKQAQKYKYRFCSKCIQNPLSVNWKCLGCGKIISGGYTLGRYYCQVNCIGRLKIKRERENQRQKAITIAKRHLRNSLKG